MIINPFKQEESKISAKEDVKLELLQKYLIDNFMQLLINEEKDVLKEKVRDYLYEKYSISDEVKIIEYTNEIFNKIFGYGIFENYLNDENITDIRVVKYNSIYIKEKGTWKKSKLSFKDENEFIEYIRYVVLKNGKTINFDTPLIVFSDRKRNLRIEAGISPVNVNSASLVIRIHRNDILKDLESLMNKYNMFDKKVYEFLLKIISEKKNLVIAGKGGSGKTTLLKAIIQKLPDEMAISTNEETAELIIENKNVIQREIMKSRNIEQEIGLDVLTKHSLVSSNDAIIIGELKGKEASVFFDSISTGHLGYATVHSDCAENTIDRLVTLIKRDIASQQYKEEFIQKLLSKSIDYIIYMKDFKIYQIIKINCNKTKIKYEYIFDSEVM